MYVHHHYVGLTNACPFYRVLSGHYRFEHLLPEFAQRIRQIFRDDELIFDD